MFEADQSLLFKSKKRVFDHADHGAKSYLQSDIQSHPAPKPNIITEKNPQIQQLSVENFGISCTFVFPCDDTPADPGTLQHTLHEHWAETFCLCQGSQRENKVLNPSGGMGVCSL